MKKLAIVVASVLMSYSAQAQTACTEMGCESGVTIQVPQVRFHAKGKYVYLLSLDGKKQVKCTASLPMKSCDKPAVTCSDKSVMIMEEGCALPPEDQRLGDIHITAQPKKLKLQVLQDSKIVASQEWKPVYSKVHPNGVECGPVCRQAAVNLKTH